MSASPATLDLIWRRAWSCCERCGISLLRNHGGYSIHHRRRRRPEFDGVHRAANLLLLCGSGTTGCHAWVHGHPLDSRTEGFIVSSYAEPSSWGVRHAAHGWVLLDDEGGVDPWVPEVMLGR
jgi:hypothetical protein